jgi:hypothetical protein
MSLYTFFRFRAVPQHFLTKNDSFRRLGSYPPPRITPLGVYTKPFLEQDIFLAMYLLCMPVALVWQCIGISLFHDADFYPEPCDEAHSIGLGATTFGIVWLIYVFFVAREMVRQWSMMAEYTDTVLLICRELKNAFEESKGNSAEVAKQSSNRGADAVQMTESITQFIAEQLTELQEYLHGWHDESQFLQGDEVQVQLNLHEEEHVSFSWLHSEEKQAWLKAHVLRTGEMKDTYDVFVDHFHRVVPSVSRECIRKHGYAVSMDGHDYDFGIRHVILNYRTMVGVLDMLLPPVWEGGADEDPNPGPAGGAEMSLIFQLIDSYSYLYLNDGGGEEEEDKAVTAADPKNRRWVLHTYKKAREPTQLKQPTTHNPTASWLPALLTHTHSHLHSHLYAHPLLIFAYPQCAHTEQAHNRRHAS